MDKVLQSAFSLLLPFLFIIQIGTSEAEDIAVYWGQSSGEGTLTETCATGKYSFVIIAFLQRYGSGTTSHLNLAGHCDASSSSGCTAIGTEIRYCQKQGIKVMLSLDGGAGNYNLGSSEDAKNLSDHLWRNFLGGSSTSRPLGDTILDGIDIYMGHEYPASNLMVDFIGYLKSHSTARQKVYLSAATPCKFPNSTIGTAFGRGLIDYFWVQFYDDSSCEYTEASADNFVNSWNKWTTSVKGVKVFLGLPASQAQGAAVSGYVPVDLLVSKVIPVLKKSPNYGGVMLWTRYYDRMSGYSNSIQLSAMCTQQISPKCRTHDIGFVQRFGYMSTPSFKVNGSENLGLLCCEVICRNNCSCEAYAPINQVNNTGCQIWVRGTRFIRDSRAKGQPIYIAKHKGISSFPKAFFFCVGYCFLSIK